MCSMLSDDDVPAAASSAVSVVEVWGALTATCSFTPLDSSCFSFPKTFLPCKMWRNNITHTHTRRFLIQLLNTLYPEAGMCHYLSVCGICILQIAGPQCQVESGNVDRAAGLVEQTDPAVCDALSGWGCRWVQALWDALHQMHSATGTVKLKLQLLTRHTQSFPECLISLWWFREAAF